MPYIIINRTDNIIASPHTYPDGPEGKKQMDKYVKGIRDRLRQHQGYYLTSNRERIDVDDVVFEYQYTPEEDSEDEGVCSRCGQWLSVHNDDGSCVKD